jgi:hypothetical protein
VHGKANKVCLCDILLEIPNKFHEDFFSESIRQICLIHKSILVTF